MYITRCSDAQMLIDDLFTSVGVFTRVCIDKPLIKVSTGPPIWPDGGSAVACDKHLQRDEHDHHDQPGQGHLPYNAGAKMVLHVDVTSANGNAVFLTLENVDTTKDTWNCRYCHYLRIVITRPKQFLLPETSLQVGETHDTRWCWGTKRFLFVSNCHVMIEPTLFDTMGGVECNRQVGLSVEPVLYIVGGLYTGYVSVMAL